ncbi:hypothetical protein ACP70R_025914 [Stipagrostis hirtigluma subsp. patula]
MGSHMLQRASWSMARESEDFCADEDEGEECGIEYDSGQRL